MWHSSLCLLVLLQFINASLSCIIWKSKYIYVWTIKIHFLFSLYYYVYIFRQIMSTNIIEIYFLRIITIRCLPFQNTRSRVKFASFYFALVWTWIGIVVIPLYTCWEVNNYITIPCDVRRFNNEQWSNILSLN